MKNPKILLLVEDEPLIRAMLSEALADEGYEPVECGNGAEAMTQIKAHPDARGMITDIRLGSGPSGWEIARHGRLINPSMAVVYVSGDSGAEWQAEGVPESKMVSKPFTSPEVVGAISGLLRAIDSTEPPPLL